MCLVMWNDSRRKRHLKNVISARKWHQRKCHFQQNGNFHISSDKNLMNILIRGQNLTLELQSSSREGHRSIALLKILCSILTHMLIKCQFAAHIFIVTHVYVINMVLHYTPVMYLTKCSFHDTDLEQLKPHSFADSMRWWCHWHCVLLDVSVSW